MTSVINVFEVTSKVLELVPSAEPAAKAFERAANMLENVQVAALRTSADDLDRHMCKSSSDHGKI
jgi:hypothetical protein